MITERDKAVTRIDALYSNPHIVRSQYLNPVAHVSDSGNFAVLAYNLDTYVAAPPAGSPPG
ncbi:hypothetical protein ACIP2Z_27960 [Streptomyces iakyrus]|uniref:Uncharacterized protein n=1 Tax=Streptomyces iakyrus TaxID=68219 RepID=A0ABW8FL42_9ACTN